MMAGHKEGETMTKAQLEDRKAEIALILDSLQKDAMLIWHRANSAKRRLKYVENEEDARRFDRDFEDLEEGCEYLRIF